MVVLSNFLINEQEVVFLVIFFFGGGGNTSTVEPRYNEDLETMKITLLYQVSRYIRVKNKV